MIGGGGIFVNGVQSASLPPGVSGLANNGLSVATVSGNHVLGNDVGDLAAPGKLLSNRDIITENPGGGLFTLAFKTAVTAGISTTLNGQFLRIVGGSFATTGLTVQTGDNGSVSSITRSGDNGFTDFSIRTGVAGQCFMTMATDNEQFDIFLQDQSGFTQFNSNGIAVWRIRSVSPFNTQIGPTLTTFNTATLQITGTCTKRNLIQSQGAGTYAIDRDLDSGKTFRNTGALILSLPNLVGANARNGFYFDVAVTNVAGITVDADTGVLIFMGGNVSSSGGTLTSITVGSCLRIMAYDSLNWIVQSFCGTWGIT